ncbi:MAG: hypothetical protein AB1730_03145 [Myxococcota bacterium]|jgi:hypothetical protein
MPPDVLLALASSGLTLVASLLFLVSDDAPIAEGPEDPRQQVGFCLPPSRGRAVGVRPPPLPSPPECAVAVRTAAVEGVLTLKPQGDEWLVTLDSVPMADVPALALNDDGEGTGAVHDLRWHGKAGVARAVRRSWKQRPGQA